MTDLASAPVQLVTTGVDWTAVTAAIVGGVVGLAGIVFAWRQSKMTISAEDTRAWLVEKRRVYAGFLATCNEVVRVANTKTRLQGKESSSEARADIDEQLEILTANIATSMYMLELVAPDEVNKLARYFVGDLGMGQGPGARNRLIAAMRADLGITEGLPTVSGTEYAPGDPSSKTRSAATTGHRREPATAHNARAIRATSGYVRPEKRKVGGEHHNRRASQ